MTDQDQNQIQDPGQTPDPNANKINISGILAKKAMLVKLETSCWAARKTDKGATKELLESKNADALAGSFTKALIDRKNSNLKKIRETIGIMKKYHNSNTLPWNNDGSRLLPSSKHADYSSFFRKCQRDLSDAVKDFLLEYNNLKADATYMLGNLYEQSDYPELHEVESKFNMNVDFLPVPQGSDFRVDIPDFEQKRIARQLEERVEEQHALSMKKVWKRIFNTVEHLSSKLADADAIFRNSLVENIQQLVDILPQLNILEDKNLEDMTQDLKDHLCGYTPDELRKDKDLRQEVAEKSKDLLKKIDSFAGFGGLPGYASNNKESSNKTDSEKSLQDQYDELTEDSDQEDSDQGDPDQAAA